MGQGTFRFPTEAEWEYACRAGTMTRFYWGDDLNYTQINEYAWYKGNSGATDNYAGSTHEVGLKLPNAWGLFDMSGNVWEWCQEWYGSYSSNDQIDPKGPNSGIFRVLRGGDWLNNARYCLSADRNMNDPDIRYSACDGFSVARTQ